MEINYELEKFILNGLVKEWNSVSIFYGLNNQDSFFCPDFSLSDSKSFLGSWNFLKKEIKIQRAFAYTRPWHEISYVLKHEMAHQYCDLVIGKKEYEPSHGSSFKKACKIFRIPHCASFDLFSKKDPFLHHENVKFKKIQKLLSLSASPNKNEAEAALEKAHELMVLYNFDFNDLEKKDFISVCLGSAKLRHFKENYYLSAMLSKYYFVYPVWIPCYVKKKGKTGKILEISGKRENIFIASYVYDCVKNYIDASWADFNKNKKYNRYNKSDFAIGVINGFSLRLDKKYEKSSAVHRNLPIAILADPDLKEYIGWYYPNLKKSSKKGNISKNLYDQGIKKGRELIVSKGVSSHKTTEKKFLSYVK